MSYHSIRTTQKRLELSTSAVTGRRSNQLSHWASLRALSDHTMITYVRYISTLLVKFHTNLQVDIKWTFGDSNPGPIGYEPIALTN